MASTQTHRSKDKARTPSATRSTKPDFFQHSTTRRPRLFGRNIRLLEARILQQVYSKTGTCRSLLPATRAPCLPRPHSTTPFLPGGVSARASGERLDGQRPCILSYFAPSPSIPSHAHTTPTALLPLHTAHPTSAPPTPLLSVSSVLHSALSLSTTIFITPRSLPITTAITADSIVAAVVPSHLSQKL